MNNDIQEIEEVENPSYEQGFNSGFLIGKHESNLSDKLLVTLNKNNSDNEPPYIAGLRYGMLVYELEKIREKHAPNKTSHDKEMDKGNDVDIEPTR